VIFASVSVPKLVGMSRTATEQQLALVPLRSKARFSVNAPTGSPVDQ
jgi:hypothetical protein